MRPTSIPAEAVWKGARRVVLAPPGSDPFDSDIAPLEVVLDEVMVDGQITPRFNVRCALEPGDLDKLAAGGNVWITFYGGMVPMNVDVTGPDGR